MGAVPESMSTMGSLRVQTDDGSQTIHFDVVLGEYSKQQFVLEHTGDAPHALAWKIMTTDPKNMFVRPNTGVLQPGHTQEVQTLLGKMHEMPNKTIKYQVLTCELHPGDPAYDKDN